MQSHSIFLKPIPRERDGFHKKKAAKHNLTGGVRPEVTRRHRKYKKTINPDTRNRKPRNKKLALESAVAVPRPSPRAND